MLLSPSECQDNVTVMKLEEQGIAFSNVEFEVRPPNVILRVGPCELRILQSHFIKLAKWYLEEQDIG